MRVLCIGAHVDDIELGCGGSLYKHCVRLKDWDVTCLVLGVPADTSAILVAQQSLKSLGALDTTVCNLSVDCLAESRQSVWMHIRSKVDEFAPERIITVAADLHQDHETVYKETLRASVGVDQVLAYHIAPSRAGTVTETYYETLCKSDLEAKVQALEMYSDCSVSDGLRTTTYRDKVYMQGTAVRAQAVVAGTAIRGSLAESFSVARLVVK